MHPLSDAHNVSSCLFQSLGQALGFVSGGIFRSVGTSMDSMSGALAQVILEVGKMLEAGFHEVGQGRTASFDQGTMSLVSQRGVHL